MKWVTRLAVGRPGSMEGTDAKVVNGEEYVMATKRDSPTFISGHDLPMNKERKRCRAQGK